MPVATSAAKSSSVSLWSIPWHLCIVRQIRSKSGLDFRLRSKLMHSRIQFIYFGRFSAILETVGWDRTAGGRLFWLQRTGGGFVLLEKRRKPFSFTYRKWNGNFHAKINQARRRYNKRPRSWRWLRYQQNKCVDRICNGGSQTGNAYLRFAFLALSINFQASQSLLLHGYGCQTEGVIGSVVSPRR